MKIDLRLIEEMVNAGASGAVILAYLRAHDAKSQPRKAADRVRKGAEKKRKPADTERDAATLNDTPRARLFREGTAALIALGRTERAARSLIAQWLKLTHDDDQLVLATVLRARDLAVADVAGWVLATLNKGKSNGQSTGRKSLASAADDLIARAESFEREADFGRADDA